MTKKNSVAQADVQLCNDRCCVMFTFNVGVGERITPDEVDECLKSSVGTFKTYLEALELAKSNVRARGEMLQ